MSRLDDIIKTNKEIVKEIKKYLDIINIQFLEAHMLIRQRRAPWRSDRSDPPDEKEYNEIYFDSQGAELLGKYEYILTCHNHDKYIHDLCDHYVYSIDECRKEALESYNRDEHIKSLVGQYCLESVWDEGLTSEERSKAQDSLLLDFKSHSINISSLTEFDVRKDNLVFSCEIVKVGISTGEIILKKTKGTFGECVTYYNNTNNISKEKSIDIPSEIEYMSKTWKVIDLSEGFFNNCKEAETIVLPGNLKTFNWSFWNCPQLKEIKIKEIPYGNVFSHDGVLYRFIGDIAQRHNECELIAYPNMHAKYYQIPDEIEYDHRKRKVIGISKFAFKDCDNIETLYIPKSVKYIGLNAFYRCNNLRTVYYFGFQKDLKVEGFYGDYGSVNPIWLCKSMIPAFKPKVKITFSENEKQIGILKFLIGGVKYNLLRFSNKYSSYFIGETAVMRALWKIVMEDYPENQKNDHYAIHVTYPEALEFIRRFNRLTRLQFELPWYSYWFNAAKGEEESIDYSGLTIIKEAYIGYPVKSVKTNNIGMYDMFGPGEFCKKENEFERQVPLVGHELLGRVSGKKGIADPEGEKYFFRLCLDCKDSEWRSSPFFKSEE